MWPSHQFDAANSGKSPCAGVKNPVLRWTFKVPANVFAGPAIGPDGTLYFGTQDATLYAVGKDGKQKWKFTSEDAQYSSPYGGIDQAPAVDDSGCVYFGTAHGLVYCLSPAGNVVWKWQMRGEGEVGTAIKPMPDGAVCFGALSGESGGCLYVVKGGKTVWSYATKPIVGSTPAAAPGGTLYFGVPASSGFEDSGMLCAVAAPGKLLWTAAVESPIVGAPALDKAGNVYCLSGAGVLRKYSPSGSLLWTAETEYLAEYEYELEEDGIYPFLVSSSPAVTDNGRVTICVTDMVYSYRTSGELMWTYDLQGAYGSPIADAQGAIYCGWNLGAVCLGPEGGLKWSYKTAPESGATVMHSFAMDSSGWIYFAVSAMSKNEPGGGVIALGPLNITSLSIARTWTQQDFMPPTPRPSPWGMYP
jgi:outer membrane protein assembly factor BamB